MVLTETASSIAYVYIYFWFFSILSHVLIRTKFVFFLWISVSSNATTFLSDSISFHTSLNWCLTAVSRLTPRLLIGTVGSSSLGVAGDLASWEMDWEALVPAKESWLVFSDVCEAFISSRPGLAPIFESSLYRSPIQWIQLSLICWT